MSALSIGYYVMLVYLTADYPNNLVGGIFTHRTSRRAASFNRLRF